MSGDMAQLADATDSKPVGEGSNPSILTVDDLLRRYSQEEAAHVQRVASLTAELIKDDTTIVGWEYQDLLTTALLHDIVEDTVTTLFDVAVAAGMNVEDGVRYLTREDYETYDEYIESLCALGPIPALIVKMADIIDHLGPVNIQGLKPSMQKRYLAALDKVLNELRGRQVLLSQ
jgi:(p)ppGpp synthase/HD superfamily hydrolase